MNVSGPTRQTPVPPRPGDERVRWLDDYENVRKLYRWLWITCGVLLVGGEFVLRWARSRGHEIHGFAFETWPGFFSFFGFVACFSLVLVARELRKWLMRPEDYYDGDAVGEDERAG